MDEKRVLDANLSPRQSSVKKLVERFEKPEIVTTKTRCQPVSRHHSSKQVFADIYQKRSILKRQSKNHTDIRPNGRSSAIVGRRGVIFKGYGHGDQIDFIAAISCIHPYAAAPSTRNALRIIASQMESAMLDQVVVKMSSNQKMTKCTKLFNQAEQMNVLEDGFNVKK